MPVWRYEGNKVWEYIILAKCLSNCCQLKFYFLAISILVLGSRGLNCLKHHTVVEVEWRCHRCAKNKGTTFLRLHPSNIGDEIDVDEDGDLNGEKNETTAKHPSDIVTAVNVFGYSPGSRQLTSQQKGKEKGKTVCYSQKKGKLPVILQEFLWTENCERLLKRLYVEHNHSYVCELIRMQDITRLRSESFQWIIQEGRAWPPPTDENMFRYARTRLSKTWNQLSFGVCHLEQVIKSSSYWVVKNGLNLNPTDCYVPELKEYYLISIVMALLTSFIEKRRHKIKSVHSTFHILFCLKL